MIAVLVASCPLGAATRPRVCPRNSLLPHRMPPKGSGGAAKDDDGMALVMKGVAELERIMEMIPAEFIPEFEEAAMQLIGAFKEGEHAGCGDHAEGEHTAACGHGREAKRRKTSDRPDPFQKMKEIQHWLRLKVPAEAVLPSETIVFGDHEGTEFVDYTAQNTQSVDGFLYEEDDVDELCEAGKLARSFCTTCGSRSIKDLNFISHSLSIRELEFVFKTALPDAKCDLMKCCVVDVGSRLGAVVYGACVFGAAREAVGVEINAELCKVQEETLKVFGLSTSARVVAAGAHLSRAQDFRGHGWALGV